MALYWIFFFLTSLCSAAMIFANYSFVDQEIKDNLNLISVLIMFAFFVIAIVYSVFVIGKI